MAVEDGPETGRDPSGLMLTTLGLGVDGVPKTFGGVGTGRNLRTVTTGGTSGTIGGASGLLAQVLGRSGGGKNPPVATARPAGGFLERVVS